MPVGGDSDGGVVIIQEHLDVVIAGRRSLRIELARIGTSPRGAPWVVAWQSSVQWQKDGAFEPPSSEESRGRRVQRETGPDATVTRADLVPIRLGLASRGILSVVVI